VLRLGWLVLAMAIGCRPLSSREEGFGGGASGSTPGRPQADEDGRRSPPVGTPVISSDTATSRHERVAGARMGSAHAPQPAIPPREGPARVNPPPPIAPAAPPQAPTGPQGPTPIAPEGPAPATPPPP
jgi:hypothetical protein